MPQPASLPPCSKCAAPNPRFLAFTSDATKAATYQCAACGDIWKEDQQEKKVKA
jgi:hypothetical protein